MAFKIVASNGSITEYDDDVTCSIDDSNGVLTVWLQDGRRHRYSPSGWLMIEDLPDTSVPEVTGVQVW